MIIILNKQQQKLVEENYSLIYSFLHKHKLSVELFYDLAAIGLCKAAIGFNGSTSFSTYAYKCMWNSVFSEIKKEQMQKRIPKNKIVCYEETIHKTECGNIKIIDLLQAPANIEDDVCTKVLWQDAINTLNEKEKTVLDLISAGYTQSGIGEIIGCTQAEVSRIKTQIQKKFKNKLNIARCFS